jgi:hypothetical protein
MMTFRTPASWKSLIKRSAFFSPRLCGTFLGSANGQEQEPHIHEGVSVFSIVCNRHWLNGVQGPVTNLGIACLTHPPALSYSGCVLTLTLVRAEK